MRGHIEHAAFRQNAAEEGSDHTEGQHPDGGKGDQRHWEEVFHHAPKLRHEDQTHDEHRVDAHRKGKRHREKRGLGVGFAQLCVGIGFLERRQGLQIPDQ